MNNKIVNSMEELIGNTPLYRPMKWLKFNELENSNLSLKLEGLNITGSVKDRAAYGMIIALEKEGRLTPGVSTIIEATSGNMGISLAAIAASRGYKAIFTLPETMTEERRKLLGAYGAKLVLTPGGEGMKGAINKAKELNESIEDSVIPSQFINPSNPAYHEKTTGPEIWDQTEGKVDVVVAGVGTGGTISGAGHFLKQKNPNIELIAVEPDTSAVISGQNPGKHGIQGIGAGFIPENLDIDIVDKVVQVSTEEAKSNSRDIAKLEGVLVGISSGAALAGAKKLLANESYENKNIVVILPDSGDRYLSTDTFQMIED